VTNIGNVSLTNLVVNDTPLGLVPLGQDSLAAGQATTGILTYTVVEADLPGPLTNIVVITGDSPGEKITATTKLSVLLKRANKQFYLPLILKSN
jgi:hypothetical protein